MSLQLRLWTSTTTELGWSEDDFGAGWLSGKMRPQLGTGAATAPTRIASRISGIRNRGLVGCCLLCLPLEVSVIPFHVPLQPVALIAGLLDLVVPPRKDDPPGVPAQTLQRLIHLLRVEEKNGKIFVPAH